MKITKCEIDKVWEVMTEKYLSLKEPITLQEIASKSEIPSDAVKWILSKPLENRVISVGILKWIPRINPDEKIPVDYEKIKSCLTGFLSKNGRYPNLLEIDEMFRSLYGEPSESVQAFVQVLFKANLVSRTPDFRYYLDPLLES